MTQIVSWAITALVVTLLLTYASALISLHALPMGERPRTRAFDRFGNFIAETENPDYHENPGEDSLEEPDNPSVERPPHTAAHR